MLTLSQDLGLKNPNTIIRGSLWESLSLLEQAKNKAKSQMNVDCPEE